MMGNSFWFSWEPRFIEWIQGNLTPIFEKIASYITVLGEEYAVIFVLGLIYWCFNKELGKKIGVYAVSILVFSTISKDIVLRRRPYFDHKSIRCVKPRSADADINDISVQGYSFPSGHSADSICVYGATGLNVKNKVLKTVLFLLVPLIGLSRIVLGVHYPTDVLAGWALSLLIMLVLRKITDKKLTYLILFLLGLSGCFFAKGADYYASLGIMAGYFSGVIFEEKYVDFKKPRSFFIGFLRVLGGMAGFILLDFLLKLPFSGDFLNSPTPASFAVRAVRYFIILFVLIGVYPILFNKAEQFRKKSV